MFTIDRIVAEHSLEANFLKIRCMENEKTDDIAIRVIQNDRPDFLLTLNTIEVNNMLEFRYILGNQIALEYMNFVLSRSQFLKMYRNLMRPFLEGNDWMLDYHCFCVDPGHVFLDKSTYAVSYMYIPIKGAANSDDEILSFLRNILNKVTITDDSSFLVKLYQIFSNTNVTLRDVKTLVDNEYRNENVGKRNLAESKDVHEKSVKKENVEKVKPIAEEKEAADDFVMSLKPVVESKQEKKNFVDELMSGMKSQGKSTGDEETKKKSFLGSMFSGEKRKKETKSLDSIGLDVSDDENEVLNALFGEPKKNEKHFKKAENGKKKNKKEINEIKEVKAALSGEDIVHMMKDVKPEKISSVDYNYTQIETDGDVTEIEAGFDNYEKPHLELLNEGMIGVPTHIDLEFSKPQLVIGRQSSDQIQPDIAFAAHYKKIGRMHACLKREKDRVYLVDLGSANGTTINGKIMIPNQPYELKNQDRIGFVASDPIGYKVVI